jgi:hypothetical protein
MIIEIFLRILRESFFMGLALRCLRWLLTPSGDSSFLKGSLFLGYLGLFRDDSRAHPVLFYLRAGLFLFIAFLISLRFRL